MSVKEYTFKSEDYKNYLGVLDRSFFRNGNERYFEIEPYDSFTIYNNKYLFSIKDINIYGEPNPRVVEVEFISPNGTKKVKSVCDKDDNFDLEYGVYIAIVKYLFRNILTTEGIEEKAHELSLYKNNCKNVRKAIKSYNKKIKELKIEEKKKEEHERARLRKKEKNHIRRQKVKERKQKKLIELINETTKNS